MNLTERIDAAILRISRGQAPMRIPVDATDPDTVLADCATRIRELEEQLAQSRKAEEEAAALVEGAFREGVTVGECNINQAGFCIEKSKGALWTESEAYVALALRSRATGTPTQAEEASDGD